MGLKTENLDGSSVTRNERREGPLKTWASKGGRGRGVILGKKKTTYKERYFNPRRKVTSNKPAVDRKKKLGEYHISKISVKRGEEREGWTSRRCGDSSMKSTTWQKKKKNKGMKRPNFAEQEEERFATTTQVNHRVK